MISKSTSQQTKRLKPNAEAPGKYKTEICRNWQNGHCAFGLKCTFAHGASELRVRKRGKSKAPVLMPYTESLLSCVERRAVRRLPVFEALTNR